MTERLIVNIGENLNYWNYLRAYRDAFHVMFSSIKSTEQSSLTITPVLLFIARHSLEIGFKANIQYFKKFSKSDACLDINHHDLATLFGCFKFHIEETFANLKNNYSINISEDELKQFYEYLETVEKLSHQFHILD